jgi:hypothetical protein
MGVLVEKAAKRMQDNLLRRWKYDWNRVSNSDVER